MPRLIPILSFCILISCQSVSQTIEPGEVWRDNSGNVINAHGGGILEHEGVFYWFGEHRDAGKKGFSTWKGVRCYASQDLVNWQDEGIVLSVVEDKQSEITAGCNIERPKVIYNQSTGKFVMWFHLELKGQGYNAARTGVAIADTPTGPYQYLESFRPNAGKWPVNFKEEWKDKNHGKPQSWTPEWRDAIKEGMLLQRDFEKGQMSRDMTLFVDDDGTAYHIHSAEENLTLHISELTDDYLDFTGRYTVMEPAGHNEAPAVFKIDHTYYMITSGCTGWTPNEARSFKSSSMFGLWEPLGNPCVGSGADRTFDGQSTYVIQYKDQFILMADRWKPDDLSDSRYIWLPIEIRSGRPVIEWKDEWSLE